ncbi:MAG: HNH endonuclease [Candidatus Fonsibacter ubiquis]|nr:HNH endonuclease [Candidatus Fonsibacter ubiquis]
MIIKEINSVPLDKCPALVLNADYRPLSYYPLSLWCWQDAVRDVFLNREFPNFTRFNVFLRDRFSCQYCGSNKNLTFDHVIPRSRGGITCWENVVSACCTCNVKKGGKLPSVSGMIPKVKPYRPTVEELHDNGKFFPPNFLHQSWLDYLYWDVKLES